MTKKIEPRVLKGFRDYLPAEAILRSRMISKIASSFENFGFAPIDTPALEYAETLVGRGSAETDKQLYRFADNGKRDVALRFDLTIPLARYAALHADKLGIPFRRYHIAPVWRAEKPQRGRFREFIQCDIDIIGCRSETADAEVMATISNALEALELPHQLRINSREISNAWFEHLGLSEKTPEILRALDKIDKAGKEAVIKELQEKASVNLGQIDQLFALSLLTAADDAGVISGLRNLASECSDLNPAIDKLEKTLDLLPKLGMQNGSFKIDLSIARGLDYYTGIVFETDLISEPAIGSIASGGRYDNLASMFTKKELPGSGASIGLDRILAALLERESTSTANSLSEVLVLNMGSSTLAYRADITTKLRNVGINTELFPDEAKLSNQFKYADKKQIPFALVAGEDEQTKNVFSIKDLRTGEQHENLDIEKAISLIAKNNI